MRFPTDFQKVYHEVADRHACILIDGQSYFHAVAEHGLLAEHFFHDAMHPSLRGQIALSQAVLHELHAKGPRLAARSPRPAHRPGRMLPEIQDQLSRMGIYLPVGHYVLRPLVPAAYDSSHRVAMKEVFGQAYNRIHAGAAPESVGLANIGLPERVPAATSEQIRGEK